MRNENDIEQATDEVDNAEVRRRITMFVPRRNEAELERTQRRVLYLGEQAECAALVELLHDVVDPPYVVDHAADEVQAIDQLTTATYDAVLVEVIGDRGTWTRFIRDRRASNVSIIAIDRDGPADQRSDRRSLLLKEGAAAYARRGELTGGMLEELVFGAVERAEMRQSLSDVQERFALAVRGANDGVWEWILETGEMYFSRRWRELLGYGVDDLSNSVNEWFDRVHAEDLQALRKDIDEHLGGTKAYHESEHRIRASDGTYRWVISRAVAHRENGKPTRMAGSLTDTSDFRLREEKLREESRTDPLTGLPRREPFIEALTRAVSERARDPSHGFSVLMVDVDRFRWLADSIGHQDADRMLVILAKRLVDHTRKDDAVCRFGGDKFGVLLEGVGDVEMASEVANTIRTAVHEPFQIADQVVYTTVSIGVTTSARDYANAEDIISDVAAAANKAKERGQDRFEVFDDKMRIDALTNLHLEVALRQAVEREEFELHYQPIVDLTTHQLVGFEALTRWRHPGRNALVQPSEFIPVAEQTGLIVPIGRWAIREALRQLGRWHEALPSFRALTMSVNLSGRQIADPRLLEEIETALVGNRITPGTFRLELTESVLIDNADTVHRILASLRRLGVHIWVDDFGTGYSSLSYLHRFPVDGIKIDKTFVDALDDTDQGAAMIRAILSLASNLKVEVIAEGIETSYQAIRLLKLGCVRGQGFLFGRPLAASSVPKYIENEPSEVPVVSP